MGRSYKSYYLIAVFIYWAACQPQTTPLQKTNNNLNNVESGIVNSLTTWSSYANAIITLVNPHPDAAFQCIISLEKFSMVISAANFSDVKVYQLDKTATTIKIYFYIVGVSSFIALNARYMVFAAKVTFIQSLIWRITVTQSLNSTQNVQQSKAVSVPFKPEQLQVYMLGLKLTIATFEFDVTAHNTSFPSTGGNNYNINVRFTTKSSKITFN